LQKVDGEIRRLIDEQYALAEKILREHADKIEAMTAALMEYETIDADQVKDIMAGRPVKAAKDWSPRNPSNTGSNNDSGASPAVTPQAAPNAA
jgi:cell division protease FtsH